MNELHSLLKRQLRRFTGAARTFLEEQTDFLRAINDAYYQFDTDRRMLEHSLELTSQELLERNVELSRINTDLEMRVAARTAELSSSEARFRGLFEHAPISIWEEDFSAVRQYMDDLRAAGIVDLSAYFDAHPDAVAECATRVKIVDVNHTTLEMYQAESKAQLLEDLSKVLGAESLIPFKKELVALTRGNLPFENETVNYTLRGESRDIFLRLTVAPGYEETWAKVFVGISDITERRQAEAALAAERDLLRALMDNIPDTIYFKDTASRFTRINRAQAGVLGVATPEDAIGKTDFDFFPNAELAQSFYDEEHRILETGEPLINRIEFNPTPDGQPRWFSATKVPIKNPRGGVIGIVGISRNITASRQAEAALSESEQRYRALFESAQRQAQELALLDQVRQAIARELELPLIFRTVAEGIAQTFGYTLVSLYLVDGDVLVLQHQVGYNQVIERIPLMDGVAGRVVRSQRPVLIEDVRNDPAFLGAIEGITSEVCVPLFDQGQVAGVLNVESTQGVRLSEADLRLMISLGDQIGIALGRARLYSEIRESEQRFRQLAEHIEQVFWLEDPERSQLFYISPAYEVIWGRTPQSLYEQPQSWFDTIHPDDLERVLAARVQKASGEYDIEYRVIRPDGSLRWVWSRGFPIPDHHGQVYRIAGIAEDITKRRQNEETIRHQNEMLASLHQITLNLLRYREIDPLLHALVNLSATFLDAPYVEIMLADGDVLVVKAATQNQLRMIGERVGRGDALLSWQAFDTREPAVLSDYASWPSRQAIYDSFPLHAVADFPILNDDQCLGVLSLGRDRPDYEFTLDQIQFGQLFANLTALVLNNAQLREALREQSIRDPLTGLYNRRYMEEALKQHLSRVTRHLHPLGTIMVDIDHFKSINDIYGHATGDAVLRALGQLLKKYIRNEDIACRYGGEEFMLIMPDASLEAAHERAEFLREAAKALRVQDAGQFVEGITLSLGVAIYPQHGRNIETVLHAADAALYRAKQDGRDRVVVA